MYPSKIVVTKGRTLEKPKTWEKAEFTIEIVLSEGEDPELARQYAETLLNAWLTRKAEK